MSFSYEAFIVIGMFFASAVLAIWLIYARTHPEQMAAWALKTDRRRDGDGASYSSPQPRPPLLSSLHYC